MSVGRQEKARTDTAWKCFGQSCHQDKGREGQDHAQSRQQVLGRPVGQEARKRRHDHHGQRPGGHDDADLGRRQAIASKLSGNLNTRMFGTYTQDLIFDDGTGTKATYNGAGVIQTLSGVVNRAGQVGGFTSGQNNGARQDFAAGKRTSRRRFFSGRG